MKRFLLGGWLVAVAAFGALPAKAGVTSDVLNMAALGLSVSGTSGTFTYALNNATPTVQSSAINLTNFGAVFLQVTATSGPNGVMVAWSNNAGGPFGNVGQIAAGLTLPLKKMGNFLQLTAYGYIQPSNISGFTPLKPTVSVQYLPVAGESFTLTGGAGGIGVTMTATSYGAYVAGGPSALSNNAMAVVLVGGPAGQQTMANSPSVTLASDQTAGSLASSTNQTTINTSIGTVNTSVGTVNTSVGTVNTSVQSVVTNTNNLPTGKGSQPFTNSLPVFPGNVTCTGSIAVAGGSVTMTVKNLNTVGFRLSGSWTDAGGAADKAFITNDPTGLAGWTALDIYDYTGIKQANGVNSSNGTSAWRLNVAGGQFVSISATSLTSGSFTVDMVGTPGFQLLGVPDIISFNSGSQSNGNKAITAHAMTEKLIDAGSAPTAVWGGDSFVGMTVTGSTLGTAALAFYSPGALRKFHLLGYQIYVSGLAACASSPVTFSLQDSGVNIPGTQVAVDMFTSAPTLSAISPGFRTGWIEMPDFGYTASANANVLQLKSDKALTAGTVTVQALVTFQ